MKKKHMKPFIYLIAILMIFIILKGFFTKLVVTEYTIENTKIPPSFGGFRIVQISDLHCAEFGTGNKNLIDTVKHLDPDIIVLTGDMLDSDHTDFTPVEEFLNGIQSIAPIYSVTGNHDYDSTSIYQKLKFYYTTYNICDLDAAGVIINKGNSSILLQGLGASANITNSSHLLPKADPDKFNILLYHYSNHFDYLSSFNYDLVLSGHAHGGIVRLPFVGGVLGNNGVLFPKYDYGKFVNKDNPNMTMISSGGLGDADIPRYNNNPEVVLITLKSTQN
ncbi:MAG: metallophosphoesterase [bacterium]|nr:metallophosphoesterase [bacterium]